MRGERGRVARLRLADLHEQGGAQAPHQMRGDDVGVLFGAADPLPQMVEIERFGHDDFARAWGDLATLGRSPIPGTAP